EHGKGIKIAIQIERLPKFRNRLGQLPFGLSHTAKIIMRQEKARIDLQGFTRLRFRFIEPVRGRISPRQIRIDDDRERIELGGAFPFRDRLVETTERKMSEPEPMMRRGVVRL